jgi:hypothetical protein
MTPKVMTSTIVVVFYFPRGTTDLRLPFVKMVKKSQKSTHPPVKTPRLERKTAKKL